MGVPRLGFWDHPLTAVLSIVVLFVFVEIGQLVGKLVRFLVRQLNRFAPPRVSAVVVVVPAARADHRAAQRRRGALRDGHASTRPSRRSTTRPTPTSPRRRRRCGRAARSRWSAGSRWAIRAASSCRRARRSRSSSKFNGKPAIEPIRAYAGLHSADGIKATAALAAEELRRTGGLDRAWSPSPPRPAPAGSTRPRRRRWSTCTTATPRSSACSTRSCRAGCRSSSTRRTPGRPGRRCSRPSTR